MVSLRLRVYPKVPHVFPLKKASEQPANRPAESHQNGPNHEFMSTKLFNNAGSDGSIMAQNVINPGDRPNDLDYAKKQTLTTPRVQALIDVAWVAYDGLHALFCSCSVGRGSEKGNTINR
jgi:hypothetical protein